MKFKIFVSYSTDDLDKVELLNKQLKNTELDVFIAEHSISASENLTSSITNAIKKCDLFVLIWSKNAKKSDWVTQEIGKATALEKIILPIVLDEDLPPAGFIQNLKYLPIFSDHENGFKKAEEIIVKAYQQKYNDFNEKEKAKLQKQKNKDNLLIAGIGAFLFWVAIQK